MCPHGHLNVPLRRDQSVVANELIHSTLAVYRPEDSSRDSRRSGNDKFQPHHSHPSTPPPQPHALNPTPQPHPQPHALNPTPSTPRPQPHPLNPTPSTPPPQPHPLNPTPSTPHPILSSSEVTGRSQLPTATGECYFWTVSGENVSSTKGFVFGVM